MDISVLVFTAASLGFIHTLVGPDHYLPFLAIGKARGWKLGRTLALTGVCGAGHVLGSVVIGVAGLAIGAGVASLEPLESRRGDIAAWLLTTVGFFYMIWGIKRAVTGKKHVHRHFHSDGTMHDHDHDHMSAEHGHLHEDGARGKKSITPWVLFIIFVLGPCEPLIPVLMYPAATRSAGGLALVTAAFCLTTIATMLAAVAFAWKGLSFMPGKRFERYTHAIAGGVLFISGAGIVAGL